MKGMRVQSIIRELRGEKIDIIEYSEDPVVFATHALSPAKISRVTVLDPLERHMEVIVDDSQLSLAIGKKGQNVRLAAKLLGWKIDIKSEEEKRQEVESAMAALVAPGAPVSVLLDYGMSEPVLESLVEAGVGTIENLGGMTPEQLEEIQGIGPETVERIQQAVNAYYNQFEQPELAAAGEEALPAPEPVSDDMAGVAGDLAEVEGVEPEELALEPGSEPPVSEDVNAPAEWPAAGGLYDQESAEERFEPGSALAEADATPAESDTIGYAGPESQDSQADDERSAREEQEGQQ
jgi:transcription termination/antitermination protein NusA